MNSKTFVCIGLVWLFTISGISGKFIKHNNNALVVGYKSSLDIYNALERLITNKDLRNKIALKAQEDILKYFSENVVYKNLSSLYKELIKSS